MIFYEDVVNTVAVYLSVIVILHQNYDIIQLKVMLVDFIP